MPANAFDHQPAPPGYPDHPAPPGHPDHPAPPGHPQGHGRRPVFLPPDTAVTQTEDGTIRFKMMARPDAEVTVTIGNERKDQITLPMEPQDGIYVGECSGCPLSGPQKLIFRVNGQDTLNPSAPVWFHANSLSNYVELPDPETRDLIAARKDIPHGTVRHEFYYAETYGEFVSSLVYTPPGYEEGKDYPVLYLFHEVAENRTAWSDASRLNYLLDNLIADGKCVPFLVVENDCTVLLNYHDRPDWFENYPELEQFMLRECIPYVESHFKVRSDKWSRAIAGFGLGAAQTAYIGMRNTDVFGSIGLFTAFWVSASFHEEGKDDPLYTAAQYVGAHPEEIDVFYRSEGDQDMHFDGIAQENRLLAEVGVDKLPGYVFKVYHQSHNWGSYRLSLRDMAPLLFRR